MPDYLLEEATTEYGEMNLEVNAEYNPMIIYLEQIMQVFPREMTAKHKMQPAFDESLNKMNDEWTKKTKGEREDSKQNDEYLKSFNV